jgi:hypothetical protein
LTNFNLINDPKSYVFPLADYAEEGQLITVGKYMFEILEIDLENQLMIVQKVTQ